MKGVFVMTVQELVELLKQANPHAPVEGRVEIQAQREDRTDVVAEIEKSAPVTRVKDEVDRVCLDFSMNIEVEASVQVYAIDPDYDLSVSIK